MSKGWISIVTFMVLFSIQYIQEIQGCSCFNLDPRKTFQDSDFVIRGKIVNKNQWGEKIHYTIRLTRFFKGKEHFNDRYVTISTSTQGSLCGLPGLNVGRNYLLSGHVYNNEYSINLCGFHYVWLSREMKQTKVKVGRCQWSLYEYISNPNRRCR